MAIKARDIPRILIEGLEATHPAPALFDADDTDHWPPGVLQHLLEHFPTGRNHLGFTKAANSDSCCGLAEEASPHDKTSVE